MSKYLASGLQSIRRTSEWRRWEEANKWAWEGDKRRRWAESLWLQQQTRRIQKKAFQEQQARAEARFQYEQQQEAKRRARWGYREQNFFAGQSTYPSPFLRPLSKPSPLKPCESSSIAAINSRQTVVPQELEWYLNLWRCQKFTSPLCYWQDSLGFLAKCSWAEKHGRVNGCKNQRCKHHSAFLPSQKKEDTFASHTLSFCVTHHDCIGITQSLRCRAHFAETESGGARKDFLGYYSLLGLDPDIGSSFAQPDIKRAFHEAALRWHPDRIHVRCLSLCTGNLIINSVHNL